MAAISLLKNGNIRIEVTLKVKFRAGQKVIIVPEDIGGDNPDAESGVQPIMVTMLAPRSCLDETVRTGQIPERSGLRQLP